MHTIILLITEKNLMLLATVYILIGFLLFNIPFTKLYLILFNKYSERYDILQTISGLFFIFLSFVFLLFTDFQMLWIASIALLISGLDFCLKGLKVIKKELYVLAFVAFIYSVFFSIASNSCP